MADAKLKSIVAAIRARLAVPNGAGIYHVNTSGAGQVKRHMIPMTPIPAGTTFPHWQVVPLFRGDTDPGPTNGTFLEHGVCAIIGYVVASSVDAREDAAIDMMHDGWNALELGTTLGGLLYGIGINKLWEANGLEFDGNAKLASCSWEYHFDFTRTIGAGA